MISEIESKFKQITDLNQDLSLFPISWQFRFTVRPHLSKSHGEVFTPLWLVDKMLSSANPSPAQFNLDLCAGRGQFTIRMLRKFTNELPNFDLRYYLTNFHWFNEINEDSCRELFQIFGGDINLAVGPAQELSNYPEDQSGTWQKGIFKWHEKKRKWMRTNSDLSFIEKDPVVTELF